MPIKLTPQTTSPQNRLWTAEVTPSNARGARGARLGPMAIGDLIAALRAMGCNQTNIDDALRSALVEFRKTLPEFHYYYEYALEISPRVKAALAGDLEVTPQRQFTEAWIAYALFLAERPLPLEGVMGWADDINHLVPNEVELAWAFLRLRKRGWLMEGEDSFGLTVTGRQAIRNIVSKGTLWEKVKQLENWTASHPP